MGKKPYCVGVPVLVCLLSGCSASSDGEPTVVGGSGGTSTGPAETGGVTQPAGETGGVPDGVSGAEHPSGGASGSGGASAAGGSPPSEGGGGATGMAGTGGQGPLGGGEANGGAGGASESSDERPWFSFFATSQAGLLSLAPDQENGFGGNLGGLEGADQICATLAQRANPGDKKVWRAFLSATSGPEGTPVNAIDRIGNGPWYDFNQRLFAEDKAGLAQANGRPAGADPQLAEMFTDENGDVISPDPSVIDNHDMLTGSDENGHLDGGLDSTCQDWTSSEAGPEGAVRCGHAWPRSATRGRGWISEHAIGGCRPGINVEPGGGPTEPTVGSGGGYGGFYCFAVTQ